MIDPALIEKLESIRTRFLQALEGLDGAASFQKLYQTFADVKRQLDRVIDVARSPRVENPCVPEFTVAFVGSSGHGKTSILAEIFPDLNRPDWNWLQTNVTDTTSQALVIREGKWIDPREEQVRIHSWDVAQITRLVHAARADNDRQNIKVRSLPDYVEVEGDEAKFDKEAVKHFKFGKKIKLRPFPRPLILSPEEAADPKKRLTLTTKEESSLVPTGPVLQIDGQEFDALQLRAVIKSIELRDSFHRIRTLLQMGQNDPIALVFVDTPGLNTSGSIKDEILRNTLAKKNQQIVVELLRHDELDLIVHLVLCGKTSAFHELWGPVREQCDEDELADIGDRLVLVINGMNIYLTNSDLKRSWQNPEVAAMVGDHFAITLEDNILKKMSTHGTFRPARICFVESLQNVCSAFGSYEEFYAKNRSAMESWARPGGVGYKTLEEKGLVDAFRQNIAAICDPQDRGQGFMLRQIVALIKESGPQLILRKYLNKNKLQRSVRNLRELVSSYYDPTGKLNTRTIQEAVKACLSFLDGTQPRAIEWFAEEMVDPMVAQFVPVPCAAGTDGKWVFEAFKKLCQHLYKTIVNRSRPPKDTEDIFRKFFNDMGKGWMRHWGYLDAELPFPTAEQPNAGYLVRHCLKFHAREMLYQLWRRNPAGDQAASIFQDADDHARMGKVMKSLEEAEKLGETLCRQYGVPIP